MLNILVKVSLVPIQASSTVWEKGGRGLLRDGGLSSISALGQRACEQRERLQYPCSRERDV